MLYVQSDNFPDNSYQLLKKNYTEYYVMMVYCSIKLNKTTSYGKGWSYVCIEIFNNKEFNVLCEEIKDIKSEIESLKRRVRSLV